MIRNSVILSADGTSAPLRLDPNTVPTNVGLSIRFLPGASGTATAQFTSDRPSVNGYTREDGVVIGGPTDNFANVEWQDIADLTAITANTIVNVDTPVHAVRFSTTGQAGGDIELRANQGYRV